MKKPKKISKKKTKKNEEKHKEETELEEEVKEAEKEIEKEQETEQQSEFFEPIRQLPITEVKAPVLERIIETQPEQQITPLQDFTDTSRTEREERRIDYFPASNEPNYGFQRNTNEEENQDKKYETKFVPPILSRRETFRQEMKQEFLRPQQEVQSKREDESLLEGIEILDQNMKLPFEQEQRKYKRHKLR